MKFTTSLIAASGAALAAAADSSSSVFSLKALAASSPIHYQNFSIYQGTLAIGPPQKSFCSVPNVQYASFFKTDDGGLYLYTDFPSLQAYVDLTEEGLGKIYFSEGVQPIDPKYKRGPFEFIQGNLYFRDGDRDLAFQACPLHDGEGYSVLLKPSAELAGPGCIDFTALVVEQPSPVKCEYDDAYNGQ